MTEPSGAEITVSIENWAREQAKRIQKSLDASNRPYGPVGDDQRWRALAGQFNGLADEMRALRHDETGNESQ